MSWVWYNQPIKRLLQESRMTDIDLKADFGLTPQQLDEKHNPMGYGEHPVFTRSQWREEVCDDNTLLGYWEWVMHQVEAAVNEAA